jgi:hypothetical protein
MDDMRSKEVRRIGSVTRWVMEESGKSLDEMDKGITGGSITLTLGAWWGTPVRFS